MISLDVLAQYYMATFVMTPFFILGAALAIKFESFERDLLWFVIPNVIGQVATYLTVGYVLRGRQG